MSATPAEEPSAIQIRPDGKASFDNIYDQPTPEAYFTQLQPLEYVAPGDAQPLVRRCVDALRQCRDLETVNVLDLCSGYGVNSALLKYRLTLEDLYRRFARQHVDMDHAESIAADTSWFRQQQRTDADVRVIGQDVAANALNYSKSVGLSDAIMPVDLEAQEPSPEQAVLMRDVDLIVVTGGLSYIGDKTFRRTLNATRRRPWALYFPLRHTNTEDIDKSFEDAGYTVEPSRGLISQRRFRSEEERRSIHARIHTDASPNDPPLSPNYLEALVKLARPEDESIHPRLDKIIVN